MNQLTIACLILSILFFSTTLRAQDDNILTTKVDGLELLVSMDDIPGEQTIFLNFEIRNATDETISVPYRYYWDFPVGMAGILTRKNGKSLTRFGSRHVLADDILDDDYENFRVNLDPGGSLEGTVNLLDMVILNDQYGKARVKPGKYKVGLSFFGNQSELLDIIVPK